MSAGKPSSLVLKFEDWLGADREAWNVALKDEGPFHPGGAFARLRKGNLKRYRQDYRHWQSFILRNRPELMDVPPAQRVREAVARASIEETRIRHSSRKTRHGEARPVGLRTPANHLQGLFRVVRAFNDHRAFHG